LTGKINLIMKILYILFFLSSFCAFSQTGITTEPRKAEEIGISNIYWTPTPATVGGTATATASFDAWQGVTLTSGEYVLIEACFKKLDWSKLALTPPSVYYEKSLGGSVNFITWEYNTTTNCWAGKITQNVSKGSQAVFTFSGLLIKEAATQREADAQNGVGFTVSVRAHTKDRAAGNNLERISTYTVAEAVTANLSVNIAVDKPSPRVGDVVKFTITAINNGPGDATGVQVEQQLPSGYTFEKAVSSTGKYTAPLWAIGNLVNGSNATLTVEAKVNPTGNYTNKVTIKGNESDTNQEDNIAEKQTVPTKCPPGANCLTFTISQPEPQAPENNGDVEQLKKDIIGKWNAEGTNFETAPAKAARKAGSLSAGISGTNRAARVSSSATSQSGGFIEFFTDGTFIIYDALQNFYTGNYHVKDGVSIDLSGFGAIHDIKIQGGKIDFILSYQQSGQQKTLQITANKAAAVPTSERTQLLCRTWELEYFEEGIDSAGNWRETYWENGKVYEKKNGVWEITDEFSKFLLTFSDYGTYMITVHDDKGEIRENGFEMANWKWHPIDSSKLLIWDGEEPITETEYNNRSLFLIIKLTEEQLEFHGEDIDDNEYAKFRFKAAKK
jgi:uncharacterized repeat protein (TIGR01451 family)